MVLGTAPEASLSHPECQPGHASLQCGTNFHLPTRRPRPKSLTPATAWSSGLWGKHPHTHSARAPKPLLVAQTLRGGWAAGARREEREPSRMRSWYSWGGFRGRHQAWPQASHNRGACFQGEAHRPLAESRCRGSAVFVTYPSCPRGSVSISAPLPGGPTLGTQWAGPWGV